MEKKRLLREMKFCLKLWKRQGYCKFGKRRYCKACGAPYLLFKLITGKHLDEKNLSLSDWQEKLKKIDKF